MSKTEKRAYWIQFGIYIAVALIGSLVKSDGHSCDCKCK